MEQGTPPRRRRQLKRSWNFGESECGSISVDLAKMERQLRTIFAGLYQQSQAIAEQYGAPLDDKKGAEDARSCAEYLTRRFEQAVDVPILDGLTDWYNAQRSSENLTEALERGGPDIESVVQTLVQRVLASGDAIDTKGLAKVLRKILGVRVRPGQKRRTLALDVVWLPANLDRITAAVRAARQSDAGDYVPLERLAAEYFPETPPMNLVRQVIQQRRAHQAVELIVGRKLNTGRDGARSIISDVRRLRASATGIPSE